MKKYIKCKEEVLGSFEYTGTDNYWTLGKFTPLEAFDKYKSLFTKEQELSKLSGNADEKNYAKYNGAWLNVLEEINNLNLSFDGQSIRDLRIDENGIAEFKLETS